MRVLFALTLTSLAAPAAAQIGTVPETTKGIALVETAVRASLKDPDSAKFEWPNPFINGWYRIPLSKKVTGWVTCGTVNAKNGYGGYGGRSAVIAAIRDDEVVGMSMDEPGENLISTICAKVGAPVN